MKYFVQVQVLLPAPSSERTLLRSDFSLQKNQSRAPSFLLFREKSRSVRLLVCKRTRDGSQSLPTFHDIAPSAQPKSLATTAFADQSCKNTRTTSTRTMFSFLESHRLTHTVAPPLRKKSRWLRLRPCKRGHDVYAALSNFLRALRILQALEIHFVSPSQIATSYARCDLFVWNKLLA